MLLWSVSAIRLPERASAEARGVVLAEGLVIRARLPGRARQRACRG